MNYVDIYQFAMMANCITIIHLCLHRIDRYHDRSLFISAVVLTIIRLVVDIICRHDVKTMRGYLGFFVVLECLLLDCVVRKMQKMCTAPPIVICFLTLCMLCADISYGIHLMSVPDGA